MKCPNCGQEFQGERCPNCGRPVSRTGNRLAAVVVLLFLVLPTAAVGACSVVGTVQMAGQSPGSVDLLPVLIGVGLVALVACIGSAVLVWKLWRS